jgi:hypothetical protein
LSDGHIRGAATLGTVKNLRIHRRRALELLPARLHFYLGEQVRVDDWYPMSDHLELLRALVEILPGAPREADPWQWLGELSAGFELREIHTTVVVRGDPRATLENLPWIWSIYHDAGTVEVTLTDAGRGCIELRDFPFATDEYCRLLTGYDLEALRLSGAEEATVRCFRRGDGRAGWEAAWQDDSGGA